MIEIEIPERGVVRLEHAVFDVNGTLATDGRLIEDVKPLLDVLRRQVTVHMLTADTHGKQREINRVLGFEATIITEGAAEKAGFVRGLGAETVAAIGNGANDAAMFEVAAIAIAVLGEEGLAVSTLQQADVLVRHIHDAIGLLLSPDRMRATLRR